MSKRTTLMFKKTRKVSEEEETVSVELSHISLFKSLREYTRLASPGSPVDLMLWLLSRVDTSNEVSVTDTLVAEYSASLGDDAFATKRTFDRRVDVLLRIGFLIRQGQAIYLINPDIFLNALQVQSEPDLGESHPEMARAHIETVRSKGFSMREADEKFSEKDFEINKPTFYPSNTNEKYDTWGNIEYPEPASGVNGDTD